MFLKWAGPCPVHWCWDYLGANSWTCIQSSEYAQYCNDNQIPSMHMMATRYFPIYANIEELLDDNRLKAKFDAVFSIACFEHLHKLPQALNVIYQALRPSGILFSMFAPIWSGPWGQHYTGTIPDRFDPIKPGQHWSTGDIFGPWDHLLMSRFKFFEHYKVKFDAAFSEELTYITYNSPQINRYYFEDYEHFFNQTKFHKKNIQRNFFINAKLTP
jgi:SAM-dependent methyltransferase